MPSLFYAAAMAMIDKDNKTLVAKRIQDHLGGYGGQWEPPSGKLETGESFEQGILREVMEEVSLEVELIAPVATWMLPEKPLVGVIFAARYISGQVKLTSEHTEYKWVSEQEIYNYITIPSLIKNVQRYYVWKSSYRP